MEKLPDQSTEALRIKTVSKVKNLTAIARKKAEQEATAALLAK